MYMVFDRMQRGSLREYLISAGPQVTCVSFHSLCFSLSRVADASPFFRPRSQELSFDALAAFAVQVGSGMAYLSSINVVHRNLQT
jgi:serine/threonine protein kinase